MPKKILRTVTRTQGNNSALKSGHVSAPDITFEFEEVPVLVAGFRKMVRELAYDVCEMALTTYICARAHGVKFTALPIFLVRDFHHGAIMQRLPATLQSPLELAGRRVGVNRGYTVTTGVWARSILQDEYGLDLSTVTWTPSGDEHVQSYVPPANVIPLEDDDLAGRLISGDLAATVGAKFERPDIGPLIDHPFEAGVSALKNRGFYPINHLVVVRDEILEENPDIAGQIFAAFSASKQQYLQVLKNGQIASPTAADKVHLAAMEFMDDPLPYGIAPNQQILEQLVEHAVTQKIIAQRIDLADLFDRSTRDMVG